MVLKQMPRRTRRGGENQSRKARRMLAEKPQFRELRVAADENAENGDFPEFTAVAPGIDVAKQAQERRKELASLRESGVVSREVSARSAPSSQEGMGKRRRTRRKKRATKRS
jgi:hypothetical protein